MNNSLATHVASDLTRVRLVLMDIDGTLVVGSEPELDNVMWQLSRLKNAHNVNFSFATGRTIFGAYRIVKSLDPKGRVHSIIAYNGGVIASPDAKPWIERLVIDRRTFLTLLSVCHQLNLATLVYTCLDRFDLKGEQETVFAESSYLPTQETDFNGMSIVRVPSLEMLSATDIVAVLVSDPFGSGAMDKLKTRLVEECGSSLRITTSGGQYIEIAHPHATKRLAMDKLCARLGIGREQVMAIGDNYNDLEMLADCGFGVAVANSPQPVKAASRFVCQHKAAQGVVEVLRLLADAYRHEDRRRDVLDSR